MSVPAPPYVFPRQRPTNESAITGNLQLCLSEFEYVLIYGLWGGEEGFWWYHPYKLVDGDVWLPACDEFFKDWAPEGLVGNKTHYWGWSTRREAVNRRWLETAKDLRATPVDDLNDRIILRKRA